MTGPNLSAWALDHQPLIRFLIGLLLLSGTYCFNRAELMNVGRISVAHPPSQATGGCGASALSTLPITSFKIG